MMGKYLPTAIGQYQFAWKLLACAQDGNLNLEKINEGTTFQENRMMIVLPDKTFESNDELIIACENSITIALGAAAITLNRAIEKKGIRRPDPIESENDQFVSLVYQIRNAFAHDIAEPKWEIRRERYKRIYEFGGMKADLSEIQNGKSFSYQDIGGPDAIVNYFEYFNSNF